MRRYHAHGDLNSLSSLADLARPEFEAFLGVNNAFERKNGSIPIKYRELIAIAVACTIQCPYCIDVHTLGAKKAGASRQEVAEAIFAAAALRAASSVTQGTLALRLFDDAKIPAHSDQ